MGITLVGTRRISAPRESDMVMGRGAPSPPEKEAPKAPTRLALPIGGAGKSREVTVAGAKYFFY